MKTNQKGFSVVEILAVVVVVGLLGLVGWLVYDRQKDKADNKSTAQTSQQTQETTETETAPTSDDTREYMTIKEWGVRLPVDSNLGGLSYTVTGKVASIRSDELDKLSGSCKSNSVNVARGMANEIVPNEISDTEGSTFLEVYNSTDVDNNDLTTRSVKVKSGDYYFVVPGFSSASCVETNESPEDEANLESETTAMLNIIRAINKLTQQ